ncbi:5-formyltetrahydrofolate cyclo-ligase [Actinomyces sp. ZJ308]|uniref:5-formyltetrahydrofolate cyclo-ligase n=1 Tax=Actinomyces sp. ZJ308 TaxID=2708342 RepID=UPI001422B95F|nr:5-formyltetrahydrofolate cyclo-ligase [Actinomyces sp. ZJ308]
MTTGALDLPDTSRLEVDDAKDELRKVLRAHRRAHHRHPSFGHTPACEALTEHALEAVAGAASVATFVSTGAEPCTRLLLERLHEAGVEVLLPVLGPHLARCWGRFQGAADLAERAPRRPPEPSGPALPAEAVGEVEVLLIPALAVDHNGRRLGQGGGWYDRMLPLRAPGTHTFAIIHPEELLAESLPVEEHDEPVDAVITAQEWFLLATGSPAHARSPES